MSLQNINNASIPTDVTCLEENDPCFFNAECCRTGGDLTYYRGVYRSEEDEADQKGECIHVEKKDIDFILEPFCLMWSPNSVGGINTLGFVALRGWPPINVDPYIAWLLPWCYLPSGGCNYCELTNGVEAQVLTSSFGVYQTTLQFNGFALSWADSAKLEFGTNAQAGIQI
jgi:hypothetical protein